MASDSVFSLSHVALPFPLSDSLYGLTPDEAEDFGVHLGSLAPRGERGTLIVSLDALLRMSSNPFFFYMAQRIEERLPSQPDGGANRPSKEQLESQQPATEPPSHRAPSVTPGSPAGGGQPAKRRSLR